MLDLNSYKSIYLQIAESIENEILLDNLEEGDQAPSTNQFAKIYQINPATAGKGLNLLVEEGILYKKRGLGMFVAKGAKRKILKKRQEYFFEGVLPEIMTEARRLEITSSEIIEYIHNIEGGNENA